MRLAACRLILAVLVAGPATQSIRAEDKMAPSAGSAPKFMNLPGLPTCLKVSIQNGDPSKGASLILAKTPAGCTIPWHWHTAGEQLMFVSGQAKVEMKDGSPATLRSSGYASLPGKGVHQFTCTVACTFFIAPEGAFDIHYVTADGKEISPDEALKSKAKAKAPMKKDMQM